MDLYRYVYYDYQFHPKLYFDGLLMFIMVSCLGVRYPILRGADLVVAQKGLAVSLRPAYPEGDPGSHDSNQKGPVSGFQEAWLQAVPGKPGKGTK